MRFGDKSESAESILKMAGGFWRLLNSRRKSQLIILLGLMVAVSIAEVLSLGTVLPFLGVLTAPEKVFFHPAVHPVLLSLGVETVHGLLLPITVLFVTAAISVGFMRVLLLYVNTKLSFAIGADFSHEIYRRTLYQPYLVHVSRNSSEVINGIVGKTATIIHGLLMPLLTLISSALILVAMLGALLTVNALMTTIAFAGFGIIYWIIILITRRRLRSNGISIAQESTQVVKALQEGLGGIRDVLIDGTQDEYCRSYLNADIPMRRAQASNTIISSSPRFAAEALGMAFIAILAYMLAQQAEGVIGAVTALGVLALGAQRLLPVLQQGYSSIVAIRGSKASLLDALDLLNQRIDLAVYQSKDTILPFKSMITLENVGFRYTPEAPWVLRGIDLVIPRGSRFGFIGVTGSGKSTLIDIIMGLLPATEGTLSVDGTLLESQTQRAWQRRIAHVPQTIFLSDTTIAENIALGTPKAQIDADRVREAARLAQIDEFVQTLPDKYLTHVGERGLRLSGGQRQRIGIARALYKRADVIVFDEATSALDSGTEHAVMDAIENLSEDLTILMIAHRLSTLRRCDHIVELNNGRLTRNGNYDEIIGYQNGVRG